MRKVSNNNRCIDLHKLMQTLEMDTSETCSYENVMIEKQQYTLNDTNPIQLSLDFI